MRNQRISERSNSDIVIRALGLQRIYQVGDTSVRALDGVDFTVRKGEYIAIMGPSGSGKTTLMNLLGCLDTPTGGSYELDGVSVAGLDDATLSHIRNRKIGFVFQTFNLLPRLSALANVELPLSYSGCPHGERHKRAAEALVGVGLGDRMHHLPNALSGGQRQRVAIARALVTAPAMLLADEPTGNLDSATGSEILDLFDNIRSQGNTLIVVTHEKSVGARADRIIHLLDGKIDVEETADATVREPAG